MKVMNFTENPEEHVALWYPASHDENMTQILVIAGCQMAQGGVGDIRKLLKEFRKEVAYCKEAGIPQCDCGRRGSFLACPGDHDLHKYVCRLHIGAGLLAYPLGRPLFRGYTFYSMETGAAIDRGSVPELLNLRDIIEVGERRPQPVLLGC